MTASGLPKQLLEIRSRVADRAKFPRKLWYPADQAWPEYHDDRWQKQFDDISASVRRTMLSLIGFALFCSLVLGQPAREILRAGTIQVPIANTALSFSAFLLVGPLLLAALTIYLHIFVGRWEILRRGVSGETLSPPYMFNLPNRFSSLISWSIFYLLPVVLAFLFALKSLPARQPVPMLVAVLGAPVLLLVALRRIRGWGRWVLWALLSLSLTQTLFLELLDEPLDLYRADLGGASLAGFDLSRADLRNANLAGANLTGTDLTDAIGTSANLEGAVLEGAQLSLTDLTGGTLQSAILIEADLSEADLVGANLSGADLSEANLSGAYLFSADLSGAKLIRVDLSGADLSEAKLIEADLFRADLSEANLFRADLSGADLSGVILRAADLRRARNITCAQLAIAIDWKLAYRDGEFGCGDEIPQKPLDSRPGEPGDSGPYRE